jgi:hypothetical protein
MEESASERDLTLSGLVAEIDENREQGNFRPQILLAKRPRPLRREAGTISHSFSLERKIALRSQADWNLDTNRFRRRDEKLKEASVSSIGACMSGACS